MTGEEAIRMLKAKLECVTRKTSGKDGDCNNHRCGECSLCYEQGNMGEQKKWLRMAIKALEQQPSEDCISRKAVLDALHSHFTEGFNEDRWWNSTYVLDAVNRAPSINGEHKMTELTKVKQRILERIETYIGDIELAEEKELTEDEKTIFESVKDIIESEFVRATNTQLRIEHIIKTTIKEYIDKDYSDTTELLLDFNHDLCERIRKI